MEQQKDDLLSVTPDILCETAKEAEMLGCTLALYHLCRGQVSLTCYHLVGLVVKASASRAEHPGFESCLRRDFFRGRVIPVT